MSNHLIILFVFLICSSALAQEQIHLKTLAQSPTWFKLLHYDHPIFSNPKSSINSPQFFLSSEGHIDPYQELRATVTALKDSPENYCKYPARRIWLESNGFSFPRHHCAEFDEWTHGQTVQSISMIFATGFLGNPASYFGHPLLKFNFKDGKSPLDHLDTAINYGAFTPAQVDPLSYAIKGMLGGYEAGFTSVDFFFHKQNYSELELRDMWEYELKLSPEKVNFIVAHLWELKDAKFEYYFFSDNCAYRMSELLELVIPYELTSKRAPYAIPASLFHRLHELALVNKPRLIRSRQTRLRDKVSSLNAKQRKILHLLVQDVNALSKEDFKLLSSKEKIPVLETILDYYSYLSVGKNEPSVKENRQKILHERLTLPRQATTWDEISKYPPHQAQRPILTQIGFTQSEVLGRLSTFRLRPVFYDLISPDAGRPIESSLTVMDTEFYVNNEKLSLKFLDLLAIESFNLSKTGLAGDGGWAWRLKVGAEQANLACDTCAVPRIIAAAGQAWEISSKLVLTTMLEPRIQSSYEKLGLFNLTPQIAALATLSRDFRLYTSAGRRYYFNADKTIEDIYSVEARLGSARTWDIRLTFQEHIDRRYGIALGYYW